MQPLAPNQLIATIPAKPRTNYTENNPNARAVDARFEVHRGSIAAASADVGRPQHVIMLVQLWAWKFLRDHMRSRLLLVSFFRQYHHGRGKK